VKVDVSATQTVARVCHTDRLLNLFRFNHPRVVAEVCEHDFRLVIHQMAVVMKRVIVQQQRLEPTADLS